MFGEKLRETRLSRGLTQQKMADKLEIALRTYQCYETGTRNPPFSTFVEICYTLNISSDYLLGLIDTPKSFLESVDE